MNNHNAAASLGDGGKPFLTGVPLEGLGFWFDSYDISPTPATEPLLLTTQVLPERTQGLINGTFDAQFYYTTFQVSSSISFHGDTPFVDFGNSSQMNLGGGNFTIMAYGYTTAAGGMISANFMSKKASTNASDPGFIWKAPNGNAYVSDGTTQIAITDNGSISNTLALNFISYEDGTLTSGYLNTLDVLFEKTATGTPIGSWSNSEQFYWGDPVINAQPGYYGTLLGYTIGIDQLMNLYGPATSPAYTRTTFLSDIRQFLSSYDNRQINPYA
jgi:hypothetical protein